MTLEKHDSAYVASLDNEEDSWFTRLWLVRKKGLCLRTIAADDPEEALNVYRSLGQWCGGEIDAVNSDSDWKILYVGLTKYSYRGGFVDLSLQEFKEMEYHDAPVKVS